MIWRNYHSPMRLTFKELMEHIEYINKMEVE